MTFLKILLIVHIKHRVFPVFFSQVYPLWLCRLCTDICCPFSITTSNGNASRVGGDCLKANPNFHADLDPLRSLYSIVELMEQDDVSQRMHDNSEAVSQSLNPSAHLLEVVCLLRAQEHAARLYLLVIM